MQLIFLGLLYNLVYRNSTLLRDRLSWFEHIMQNSDYDSLVYLSYAGKKKPFYQRQGSIFSHTHKRTSTAFRYTQISSPSLISERRDNHSFMFNPFMSLNWRLSVMCDKILFLCCLDSHWSSNCHGLSGQRRASPPWWWAGVRGWDPSGRQNPPICDWSYA